MNHPKLTEAVTLMKAGDKQAAQKVLVEVIKTDPKSKDAETAWYGLSIIVGSPDKKRQCYQAILKINPDNQKAISKLEKLDNRASSVPSTKRSPPPSRPQPVAVAPEEIQSPLDSMSDEELIAEHVALHTKQGWQVLSQTPSSVQLRKPKKEVSCAVVIIGVLLIPVGGIGLIILLIASIAYLTGKEKVIYITANELREKKQRRLDVQARRRNPKQSTKANSSQNAGGVFGILTSNQSIAVVVIGILLACSFMSIILSVTQSASPSQTRPQATATRPSLPATFTPIGSQAGPQNNYDSYDYSDSYAITTLEIGEDWVAAVEVLQSLLELYMEDPSIVNQYEWSQLNLEAIYLLESANDKAYAIPLSSVPSKYLEYHNELLAVADAYDRVVYYRRAWLKDTNDVPSIEGMTEAFRDANMHSDRTEYLTKPNYSDYQ